jgi:hypothetical protein
MGKGICEKKESDIAFVSGIPGLSSARPNFFREIATFVNREVTFFF